MRVCYKNINESISNCSYQLLDFARTNVGIYLCLTQHIDIRKLCRSELWNHQVVVAVLPFSNWCKSRAPAA